MNDFQVRLSRTERWNPIAGHIKAFLVAKWHISCHIKAKGLCFPPKCSVESITLAVLSWRVLL